LVRLQNLKDLLGFKKSDIVVVEFLEPFFWLEMLHFPAVKFVGRLPPIQPSSCMGRKGSDLKSLFFSGFLTRLRLCARKMKPDSGIQADFIHTQE